MRQREAGPLFDVDQGLRRSRYGARSSRAGDNAIASDAAFGFLYIQEEGSGRTAKRSDGTKVGRHNGRTISLPKCLCWLLLFSQRFVFFCFRNGFVFATVRSDGTMVGRFSNRPTFVPSDLRTFTVL